MKWEFFGDSYDVVKRFMLRSVAPLPTEWAAFPMFSDEASSEQIEAYQSFLGVRVVSSERLTAVTNRMHHLTAMEHHRHIFIDPDKGIRLGPLNGIRRVQYVFASELVALCHADTQRLLVIFDQSYSRCSDQKPHIETKLAAFHETGIFGFAYNSHACFVFLSGSKSVCNKAKENLLASGLPNSRIVQ